MSEAPLSKKYALVTGGSRGIGRAIAGCLQREGARVMVTGTRPNGDRPSHCEYRDVDFTDREATERFANEIADLEFDILVNNAGFNKISPFTEINPVDFDEIQAVNTRAPFLLCQAVLPRMRQHGWGRIVNINSIFGVVSKEYRAPYSTSKFALDGMTAALAAEVAAEGILANCVSPGVIETELTKGVLGAEGIEKMAEKIPMGRLGRPEEIAELVCWLAGPSNTYISGQNIVIDGGYSRI